MAPYFIYTDFTFQTQLEAKKDCGKFSPVHTRTFIRHINTHTHTPSGTNTRRHTLPASLLSNTSGTLNFICPVKLPKLPFLILPFKSKARGVIHNLRIFCRSLPPNANGNPCSTHGLLSGSEKKLLPLIGLLLKTKWVQFFNLQGSDSDARRGIITSLKRRPNLICPGHRADVSILCLLVETEGDAVGSRFGPCIVFINNWKQSITEP